MLRYETLFLAVPEITADEASTLEKQLDDLVSKSKGSVISFERWGKFKLAYPIRRYEYGVYFLMRFETDDEHKNKLLDNIKNFFAVKHADLVMRSTIQKLSATGSLEYKRPESLEEVPTRDVDSFLKEHKMTGLMSKTHQKTSNIAQTEEKQLEKKLSIEEATMSPLEVDKEELAEEQVLS
jgi:small subunit ribosomal protein S6